jgi:hypothetical protein
LEAYPGIGPATINKLYEAGYVNLATLARARIRIYGLGEKRLADIDHAVHDLLRKAHGMFDRTACPQAVALATKLEHLKAKHESLENRTRARTLAAEEVIVRLQVPIAVARQVALWRWIGPLSKEVLVPTEELEADLPDLEGIVRAADARAAQSPIAVKPFPAFSSSSPLARAEQPKAIVIVQPVAAPSSNLPQRSFMEFSTEEFEHWTASIATASPPQQTTARLSPPTPPVSPAPHPVPRLERVEKKPHERSSQKETPAKVPLSYLLEEQRKRDETGNSQQLSPSQSASSVPAVRKPDASQSALPAPVPQRTSADPTKETRNDSLPTRHVPIAEQVDLLLMNGYVDPKTPRPLPAMPDDNYLLLQELTIQFALAVEMDPKNWTVE